MAVAVTGLRSIELDVTDLSNAVRFFTQVWHLDVVQSDERHAYLRGTSRHHHILALHQSSKAAVSRIVLQAPDRATLDALHQRVRAAGVGPVEPPGELSTPGGGTGFGFKDPEGRNFAVVTGTADHGGPCVDVEDRPRRVAHVNINAADCDGTAKFLMSVLGFTMSDETVMAKFMRCDRHHNALVIGKKGPATLNHIAFELPDLESVMRSAGRLKDAGHPIEWGPGRHGPGNNVFCYFLGVEDIPIEYTSDVLILDETHKPRGPAEWTWPPGRTDKWGITEPLSKRFQRVQDKFGFTDDGYKITGAG